jgi:hypothetical protein
MISGFASRFMVVPSLKCRYFPAGISRIVTCKALKRHASRLPHKRHPRGQDAHTKKNKLIEAHFVSR